MNKLVYILLFMVIILLMLAGVMVGSVDIPCRAVWSVLMGTDAEVPSAWRFIVLNSRLPQTLTALLSGASLAVAGLMMQTVFRNPLAGPDVFGINGGAGLGVAVVMLVAGGEVAVGMMGVGGSMAVLLAAFGGAMVVMGIILFCSTLVRSGLMLLVVGIMVGYLSSSCITLINYGATEHGLRSFVVWGMGSFEGTMPSLLPLFMGLTLVLLVLSLLLIKPLNLLALGDNYARNLGLNIKASRNAILTLTGALTAVVTAYCGPIAFIGLAVPHMARLMCSTDNQQQLMPVTMLVGGMVALACHLLCFAPGQMLPLNAVTPLFGAPVIIYVILKKR